MALMMFLLGMTNSIGGFEQVMPDAQLSDGLFQLIVVKPSDPVSMMKSLSTSCEMALAFSTVNLLASRTMLRAVSSRLTLGLLL